MKFILKITVFLALILISKWSRESEKMTSATDQIKPDTATLTTYNQQGNVQEKVGEKKVHSIYQ